MTHQRLIASKALAWLFVPWLFALSSAVSVAGMPKEGQIAIPGHFFAWLPPTAADDIALIHWSNSSDAFQISQRCRNGGVVYAFQSGLPYRCDVHEQHWYPGDTSVAGISVQGPPVGNGDTPKYDLFSLSPPRNSRWQTRKLRSEEAKALQSYLTANEARLGLGMPVLHIKLEGATVIARAAGKRTTVIVPGKTVRMPEAHYEAQRQFVFTQQNNIYVYRGILPAAPSEYLDVDGDDVPEILVSEACDGWCESVWSVTSRAQRIGSFGGH